MYVVFWNRVWLCFCEKCCSFIYPPTHDPLHVGCIVRLRPLLHTFQWRARHKRLRFVDSVPDHGNDCVLEMENFLVLGRWLVDVRSLDHDGRSFSLLPLALFSDRGTIGQSESCVEKSHARKLNIFDGRSLLGQLKFVMLCCGPLDTNTKARLVRQCRWW